MLGEGKRSVGRVRDGMEMSTEQRGSFLRDHGAGVLSLAHGSGSYAFPVSYGYDPSDELLCAMLGYAPESEKRSRLRETEKETPDRLRTTGLRRRALSSGALSLR
jgi:nitroimidazol reductase NimA-like FMN-containing flavoprotein (pyridoxamine 5'-phosphate oxidase superfamily)